MTNRTESRRTVTVVFTDVTGSTSLGESLDPEAVRRVMERYFETASTVLTSTFGAGLDPPLGNKAKITVSQKAIRRRKRMGEPLSVTAGIRDTDNFTRGG